MVLGGQKRRGQHGETPCIRLRGGNAGEQQGRSAELQQRFIAAAPVSTAPGLNQGDLRLRRPIEEIRHQRDNVELGTAYFAAEVLGSVETSSVCRGAFVWISIIVSNPDPRVGRAHSATSGFPLGV